MKKKYRRSRRAFSLSMPVRKVVDYLRENEPDVYVQAILDRWEEMDRREALALDAAGRALATQDTAKVARCLSMTGQYHAAANELLTVIRIIYRVHREVSHEG